MRAYAAKQAEALLEQCTLGSLSRNADVAAIKDAKPIWPVFVMFSFEREYHNSGTHKLRLRRLGEASADMDDKFDPRGWVTIRKTDMELVEEAHGQKPPKGPQCFLKAGLSERPTTSNRYLRSDRWHTVTITADCQDRTVLIFLDGIQATEKEINIGPGPMDFPGVVLGMLSYRILSASPEKAWSHRIAFARHVSQFVASAHVDGVVDWG
ncbi:unnamed protein product [Symbiodinium sp. CCMP2592]|nr:unnamed protein product [Symbiodinium sp. CCMP2592]